MGWTWTGPPDYEYIDDEGNPASQSDLWKLSEQSIDERKDYVTYLAAQVSSGAMSVPEWQLEMRDTLVKELTRQYMLGLGGSREMTAEDYGSIGGMASDQIRYLNKFAEKIANGEYTEGQIARISRMYMNGTREAFERANARTRDLPTMPAYPGSGKACLGLTNCGCHWMYNYNGESWECYWIVDPSKENCELCIQHSVEWGPLLLEPEV